MLLREQLLHHCWSGSELFQNVDLVLHSRRDLIHYQPLDSWIDLNLVLI